MTVIWRLMLFAVTVVGGFTVNKEESVNYIELDIPENLLFL